MLALLARQLWRAAGADLTWLWLSAIGAFMVTGLTNRQIFHRYYEPTLLVLLFLWMILLRKDAPTRSRPGALYGLGAFQLMITLITAHGRTFGLLSP